MEVERATCVAPATCVALPGGVDTYNNTFPTIRLSRAREGIALWILNTVVRAVKWAYNPNHSPNLEGNVRICQFNFMHSIFKFFDDI